MKYSSLLNRKINVVFSNNIVNSYKLTKIQKTEGFMLGRGRIYSCSVGWENKSLAGTYPYMNFDEQTLNDLIRSGKSISPTMSNLYYEFDKK